MTANGARDMGSFSLVLETGSTTAAAGPDETSGKRAIRSSVP